MTDKRRQIQQLPAINQTQALKDFFGVTVDEVFQPGTPVATNGYIGQIPPLYDNQWQPNTYYNVNVYIVYNNILYQCVTSHTSVSTFNPVLWAAVDFYIQEQNSERQNYQLEPGMTSTNSSNVITNALTYPDLVDYIENNNGIITNQQRLFETDYYSWAPPIDIDKFINFQQYYWFGDLNGSNDLPTLVLSSPIFSYTGDGTTTSFALPNSISGISSNQETPAIYVNGVSEQYTISGNNIILSAAPSVGAKIITTRFDNLYDAINNQETFPISEFISNITAYNADGFTTSFADVYSTSSNENQFLVFYTPNGSITSTLLNSNNYNLENGFVNIISLPNSLTVPNYGDTISIVLLNGLLSLTDISSIPSGISYTDLQYLSSGMRIQLLDTQTYFLTWDESPWDSGLWDGGQPLYFVDGVGSSIRLTSSNSLITGLNAQYVTIDRSSLDNNPWSLRNSWVHVDTFAWSGLNFSSRQASRQIIEFVKDIVLYNYGYQRILPISATLTNNAMVNGVAITYSQIAFETIGSVYVDNNVLLTNGMRLLVLGTTQTLFEVSEQDNLYLLTPISVTVGDIAKIGTSTSEYWYNGTVWNLAQIWSESANPRFVLYDIETTPTAFDDSTVYPNSNFGASNGNEIFSYQVGTTYDSILAKYINYDSNGYIIFENDTVINIYTYLLNGVVTDITSLACYGVSTNYSITNSLSTQALWYKSTNPSTTQQTTNSNGFYNIPLNLEANPLWNDVTTLSKSEYFSHFTSIISNQIGIEGAPYYNNNWRDTTKNLGSGTEILQHQAPLLKAMLFASDNRFDIPTAIKYADQEYTRFKNKFAKKLNDLLIKGVLSEDTSPQTCVTTALNSLKIDKNNTFPFWLSQMAGDFYFIPPTPAYLGILTPTLPSTSLVMDYTFGEPIEMIQGHDGSLSPAFQDWRDNVFIALETQIYNSIPEQFITQLRPIFDIENYISNRFYSANNGYNLGELNSILAPIFERWAQIGKFDFRTNGTYDPTNPFSWNYRGCVDRYGNLMPGSWRAIYNFYFDTDKPDTCPWEMLGFTSMPSWWIANYGTNYSRGNTALWSDLETGTIRSGVRAGVDARYARPGLSNVIPVDASGNLLDPISARIILQGPDSITAARNWLFGDEGPVEHLWKTSSSYRFALSQAAFLMKPARFSEIFWDTINFQFVNDQWVDDRTRQRPIITSDTLIHGELKNDETTYEIVFGIQQWLVDNLVFTGQKASVLGDTIRGIDVNLIYRVGGFVSSNGITAQTDNFGIIPSENVSVTLYQAPAYIIQTYSGVIVEWTGAGYRIIGYDAKNPFFTIVPPDKNNVSGSISLSTTPQVTIYTWAPGTYYRLNVYVNYKNSVYQCITAHTSGSTFNESYWNPTPGVTNTIAPSITTYTNGLNYTVNISYGTVLSTIQDVGDFLLSYERYLVNQGWVFDQLDSSTATTFNFSHAAKDFLTWSQITWQPGNFIALSPGATGLKFVTTEGTILNVEDSVTGFYGLLDRGGSPIDSRTVVANRLEGEILLSSNTSDIFACTIEVANIEHVIVFSNTTIFNDIIYLPLYNQRQSRILLTGFKSSDWAGRLDAPGYMVLNNQMFSNFEKTPEDIRLMFDIEEISRPDLKKYAQSNIAYQVRTYLEDLLINSTEQFEFYQGMIAQKGAPGVFEKLLRSQRVTSNSDIVFLEEWAIRYPTTFGSPVNPLASFQLSQSSLHRDPQFISFYIPNINSPDWINLIGPTEKVFTWKENTQYYTGVYVYYQNNVYVCVTKHLSTNVFQTIYWNELNNWIDEPNNNFFPNAVNPVSKVSTAGFVRLSEVQYTSVGLSNISSYYISQNQNGITSFNTGERVWVYTNAQNTWDVLRVFDVGLTPCTINNITTPIQDSTVSTSRLYITGTLNLTQADIGAMILIQGPTYSTPDLNGVNYIKSFSIENGTIDLNTVVTTGFNFTTNSTIQPAIKIFRSVRFQTDAILNSSTNVWSNTDLVWVDNYQSTGEPVVLNYVNNVWNIIRNKPTKIDPTSIKTSSIYNNATSISTNQQLLVTTPLVDDLTIIDPLAGFFPGAATKEINYITDFDPAIYSYNNGWNNIQVGQVWWNTSTVKYLDPYTDALGITDERDFQELQYRISNWATIAPNTSVDVYEWTQSTLSPTAYVAAATNDTTGTYGTIYNSLLYTTNQLYDSSLETMVTYYYYWVKNLTVVPSLPFRKTSVSDVASLLTTPVNQDLQWMAAISENSILVSGINTYLNNTSSVLKIELDTASKDKVHSQWTLLRPNDQQSLPPEWLWRKIRDSLAGFDDNGNTVPNINNSSTSQNNSIEYFTVGISTVGSPLQQKI
jgi:hypothetical protein